MEYLDWNGAGDALGAARSAGLFVLVIGPKGTGKTSLVRDFAARTGSSLESVNFSLRTREGHLVGSKTVRDGSVEFEEGVLPRSMRAGGMLYLDEMNAAEADVLLRLDEALDDRRQLVLKEAGGQTVRAADGWFVIASINPLSHGGTKELPPQLLSRFPVRIGLEYPPEDVEMEIIGRHVPGCGEEARAGVRLANSLREAAAAEELLYSPSMRETIAFARLVAGGMRPRGAADLVFGNVYAQWGGIERRKVGDVITSVFGQ
ncbi:MAG: AAA family ATPase [Nitrosopumilus sp.]|nr:AAA family ATPase [Nitrosopumilus sp.]CAI9831694.1 ATPase [Nitrosopumilaceae archaeon]MDA7941539.1 AAA family ATPase [Nitrosopumilus sp.]MDA7943608.1 AAA family ATPase [Nitrosopumilus sp.]MDA7945601.1 AAA family ATPase [Nitrosopumilus sp.]